jgi:uncharacterized protein YecT (DUF1311 family)
MRSPTDAYREGYQKGRTDNLAGHVGQAVFGLLTDDPGGYFQAGYHDGAAGKKFSLPASEARKPAAELNPFDDKVAIKTICPNCGALDWFEWRFLGRLKDPVCGRTWYAGSGIYALMQIRAGFGAGGKFAKHLNSQIGNGEGAWIAKGLGWCTGMLLGLAIRLEFGVMMIPVQALAGLFQPKKTNSEIVTRIVALVVPLVAIGLFIYGENHPSPPQFQQVQVAQPSQLTQLNRFTKLKKTHTLKAAMPPSAGSSVGEHSNLVQPSFDCGKAHSKVELLICRDSRLALLERQAASAYWQALARSSPAGKTAMRNEQRAWLKNYSRTCDQSANDDDRANCVARFLVERTRALETPRAIGAAPVSSQTSNGRLPVDLARHCRSLGYGSVRNKDGTGYGWVCTPGDALLSVDDACREQYGRAFSARLASTPPGGMNDWYCRQCRNRERARSGGYAELEQAAQGKTLEVPTAAMLEMWGVACEGTRVCTALRRSERWQILIRKWPERRSCVSLATQIGKSEECLRRGRNCRRRCA